MSARFSPDAFFAALDKQLAAKRPFERLPYIDAQITNWRGFGRRLDKWATSNCAGPVPFNGELSADTITTMLLRLEVLKSRHMQKEAA